MGKFKSTYHKAKNTIIGSIIPDEESVSSMFFRDDDDFWLLFSDIVVHRNSMWFNHEDV